MNRNKAGNAVIVVMILLSVISATMTDTPAWAATTGLSERVNGNFAETYSDAVPELIVGSVNSDQVLRYDGLTGIFLAELDPEHLAGLSSPRGIAFGPDGNIYVSSRLTDSVLRYDRVTGAFIDAFVPAGSGGLDGATGLTFGPDGNLYVSSSNIDTSRKVLRFDGGTGEFIDEFAVLASNYGGPRGLTFGPDGNLYVSSVGRRINRFNGQTGEFIDVFIDIDANLDTPANLVFGPDGNLFVSNTEMNSVVLFNGQTGAYMADFVPAGSGGLTGPIALDFGPDGNLYVTSRTTDQILRYDRLTGAFIDAFVTTGSGGLNQPWGLLLGPPLGGSLRGLPASGINCRNRTTGQLASVDYSLATWACDGIGLRRNTGESVEQIVWGRVATPGPDIGGSVMGMAVTEVRCINRTTRQTIVSRATASSWNCVSLGLIVRANDMVYQHVIGTAN